MATQLACPACGTPMRAIVWGYGTIPDVADAGDAVIGGCVVDVDASGRVAAMQCPVCDTRADAQGVALERPDAPAATDHPFAVAFSDPLPSNEEGDMTERAPRGQRTTRTDAPPFVDEDFGGIASGSDWRDHVAPYASRDDALPHGSAPAPEHVTPYASREDALPERAGAARDRVDPYASRADALPDAGAPWRERLDPFAPDTDASPGMAEPAGGDAPGVDEPDADASPPGERID